MRDSGHRARSGHARHDCSGRVPGWVSPPPDGCRSPCTDWPGLSATRLVFAPGSADLVSVACRLAATNSRVRSRLRRPCVGGLPPGCYQLSCSLPTPPTLCRWLAAWLLPTLVFAPDSADLVSVACRLAATNSRVRSRLRRPCVGGLPPGCYQLSRSLPAPPTLCRWLAAWLLPTLAFAPGSADLVSVACRLAATNSRVRSRLRRPCVGGLPPGCYQLSCSLPTPPTLCRWLAAWLLPTLVFAPDSADLVSVACRLAATNSRVRSRLRRPCVGGLPPGCYQLSCSLPTPPTLCRWLAAWLLPTLAFAPGSADLVSVACRLAATNSRVRSRLRRPCVGGLPPGCYQLSCSLPTPPTLCRWLAAWLLPTLVFAPGSADLVSVACRLAATNSRVRSRLRRPCVGGLPPGCYQLSRSLPTPPTLCRWLAAWLLPTLVFAPGSADLVSVACRLAATTGPTTSVEDHAGQVLPRNRD